MVDLRIASDTLSRAVEGYLCARYPGSDLTHLLNRAIQSDDSQLARSLYHWRIEANWQKPHLIGERRCADCTAVMYDDPSACDDETVCAKCARSTSTENTNG